MDKAYIPASKVGLRRLEALPAFGPPLHLETLDESRNRTFQSELEDKLQQVDLPEVPADMKPRLFEAFDHCVLQWFEDFQAAGHNCRGVYPLSNRILEAFDDEAPIIQSSEDLFLEWNRVRCGDLVATFEDGEAEYL